MKRSSIGPYEVVETTYEGALSVVYRCRDHDVSRDVAVKAVRQDGADSELARRRALREARLRALIVHPHVLPLLRLVDCEGGPLLVAPWLAGGSLRELYGQAISVAQVVTLAEGIGAALDALHCAGWRHVAKEVKRKLR
jgi:serine/threonine-protein kinase